MEEKTSVYENILKKYLINEKNFYTIKTNNLVKKI